MRGVFLVPVVLALAAGCSEESRPTSPTAAVEFAGVWEGRARIVTCGGSTCDPRTCSNILGRGAPDADLRDIRIAFTQRDTSVTAGLNTNRTSAVERVEPLQGMVRDTATAALEGQLTTGAPPDHVVTRVANFVATIALNEMHGGFTYVIDRPGTAAGISCGMMRLISLPKRSPSNSPQGRAQQRRITRHLPTPDFVLTPRAVSVRLRLAKN